MNPIIDVAVKHEKGSWKITELVIYGDGSPESKDFCATFLTQLAWGVADIKFNLHEGFIIFEYYPSFDDGEIIYKKMDAPKQLFFVRARHEIKRLVEMFKPGLKISVENLVGSEEGLRFKFS